jgi:hypothetical protein
MTSAFVWAANQGGTPLVLAKLRGFAHKIRSVGSTKRLVC